jgi:UDP-N-acetylmuramoylalanine--D-glutamate ligase
VVLVGGKVKDVALDEMAATIVQRAKVAICFGEAGPRLHATIDRTGRGHAPPALHRVEHLADAVEVGRGQARPGDTVLLSPGFPSFDEFLNYEHRGDAFMSLVLRAR